MMKFIHPPALLCFIVLVTITLSCLKNTDLPTVTTTVSDVKAASAILGGNVTDDGGDKIDATGVCWGTAHNPDTRNSNTLYHKGAMGLFTFKIPNLIPDTYYHVRAFASNSEGTAYGNEVHFKTSQPVEPKVATAAIPFSATYTSYRVEGSITSYDESNRVLERGFCWAKTANPILNDNKLLCGEGSGSFKCGLCQLQPETLYYIRAYAVTYSGVTYGNEVQIHTQDLPCVTTLPVTGISKTTASVGGYLTLGIYIPDFYSQGIGFGTTSEEALTNIIHIQFDQTNTGMFSHTLSDLVPGTQYYIRAFYCAFDWCDGSILTIQSLNEVTFTTLR